MKGNSRQPKDSYIRDSYAPKAGPGARGRGARQSPVAQNESAVCPRCGESLVFDWETRDGLRTGRLTEYCPHCDRGEHRRKPRPQYAQPHRAERPAPQNHPRTAVPDLYALVCGWCREPFTAGARREFCGRLKCTQQRIRSRASTEAAKRRKAS